MDVNECVFVGRLASDPKIKEDPEDPTQTRCTFTLAVNRRFKKGKADFPRFAVWGEKKAKAVMEFCQRGKEVAVIAEYQTEWYPAENSYTPGVNFQIFRASRVIFGQDSQKVLREKEAIRKGEMEEMFTVEMETGIHTPAQYHTDKAENVSPLMGSLNKMLNDWARERYEG